MKILIKVIYIIILFVLFSCAEEDRKISLNETFVLKYGETKVLAGDQLSVTFTDLVQDSRCPANVVCIWAGQAVVAIQFQEDVEIGDVELVVGDIQDGQKSTVNTGHYVIELLKVIPFPEKAEVQVEEKDYAIQLIIKG